MNLLLLTPLIFFPLFSDLYSLPKTVYISAVSLFMVVRLFLLADKARYPLFGPIALLIVADLLSLKNAVNYYEWFFAFSIDLTGVVVFYYVVNFLRPRNTEKLLNQFVMVIAVMSVVSLTAYWFGWPGYFAGFHGGKGGPMGNPGFAAPLVAMALVIAFCQVIQANLFFIPYMAVLLAHLTIARNRASVGAWTTVFFFGMIYQKGCKRSLMVYGSAFLLLCFILMLQVNLSTLTLDHRLSWWKGSLMMADSYPVFGVGRGNWNMIYPMYAMAAGDKTMDKLEINLSPGRGDFLSKTFINAAHNDYLQMLAEVGPLGLAALLWFMWQLIPRGIVADKALGIYLAWLILPLVALFSFPFQIAELSVFFWLFSGIVALDRLQISEAPVPWQKALVPRPLPMIRDEGTGY